MSNEIRSEIPIPDRTHTLVMALEAIDFNLIVLHAEVTRITIDKS